MPARTDPGIHGLEYRRLLALLMAVRQGEVISTKELARRYNEQWQTPRKMTTAVAARKLTELAYHGLLYSNWNLSVKALDLMNLLDLATTV